MCERENVKKLSVCMYINGYEREKRESEEKARIYIAPMFGAAQSNEK